MDPIEQRIGVDIIELFSESVLLNGDVEDGDGLTTCYVCRVPHS
jgi:hypothetical protein